MKNFSLQLYSLRHETAKDFKGAIEKVAKMGYTGVEFAGYGGLEADEMKSLLDANGLKAVSSHVGIDDLENKLDYHIDFLKTCGCSYIICPYIAMETAADAIATADRLNVIAEKCAMAGMNFGYHNHAHEYAKDNDEYLFDIMMNHCSDLVLAQPDVYWVKFAGADPIDVIRKYSGRTPLIHLKQLGIVDGKNTNVVFDKGIIDFKEIVKVAEMLGTEHFIVEQEAEEDDQFAACESDAEYMKNI